MKNEYEIRGDVTAIFINSPKYGRLEVLISTDKLDLVKEFPNSWSVSLYKPTESFYVYGKIFEGTKTKEKIYLHRLIMNAPKGMIVDHINHKTLDNTDLNLRVITKAQNHQNRKGAQSNSSSEVRGVSWFERDNKWRAHITVDRVFRHIGYFNTIEEAEHAVIEARFKYMPFSSEESL